MTTARRSFRFACSPEEIPIAEHLLRLQGFRFECDPFFAPARRLLEEPFPLGSSLAGFFGLIYIQDRASMLPPVALDPPKSASVLDMCSSPGSKTSQLAWLVGPRGMVLGNEPSPVRLANLRRNLHVMGLTQTVTCCQSGEKMPLPDASWDYIQLDPPCSGWGTVEKNPRVMELWQGDPLNTLITLQRRLLRMACRLLAPGGCVVYSTCTTNTAENEEQVRYAEAELGLVREPLTPFPGFVWEERPGGEGTLRVDGQKSAAQGFYLARLRKPADAPAAEDMPPDSPAPALGKGRQRQHRASAHVLPGEALAGPCCDPSLLPPGRTVLFGDQVRFIPEDAPRLLPEDIIWQGGLLGKFSGGRLISAPRLRVLLPRQPQEGTALVLDDVQDVTALLCGQSRQTGLSGREAALWWRDLPLGRIALKQGRAVASFS